MKHMYNTNAYMSQPTCTTLLCVLWQVPAKGVVLFLHGFAQSPKAYALLYTQLAEEGLLVVAPDPRPMFSLSTQKLQVDASLFPGIVYLRPEVCWHTVWYETMMQTWLYTLASPWYGHTGAPHVVDGPYARLWWLSVTRFVFFIQISRIYTNCWLLALKRVCVKRLQHAASGCSSCAI
jgi:hypothetical protein